MRSYRTRGNGLKLPEGRVKWNIGKEFLALKGVRPWYKFPEKL